MSFCDCRDRCPGGAARAARLAWTAVAQHREGVIAGVVAVGPGGGDRIAADHRDVHQPGLLFGQDRTAVEPAGHPCLAATECARAEPAKGGRVVGRGVTVVPGDLETAGAAIRVDGDWADRHETDRTPLLVDGLRPARGSVCTLCYRPMWCS